MSALICVGCIAGFVGFCAGFFLAALCAAAKRPLIEQTLSTAPDGPDGPTLRPAWTPEEQKAYMAALPPADESDGSDE
jgi:hypothetical protein